MLEAEGLADAEPRAAMTRLRACLGPGDGPPSAWRLLAALEEEAGDRAAARRTLLQAVARHPDDAFGWAALARIETAAGRGELALAAFERAARLRPDHAGLARERRRAQERFGSGFERHAARLAPLLAEADGRAELGDVEGALGTLEAAELAAGDHGPLLARIELRRAMLHLGAGAASEGLEAARQGLEGLGEGADTAALRVELRIVEAEARLARGEPAEAARAAQSALELAPDHPLAATNLAIARLRLGDRAGAEASLLTALAGGLSNRLEREALLELEGLEDLVRESATLRRAMKAAFDP